MKWLWWAEMAVYVAVAVWMAITLFRAVRRNIKTMPPPVKQERTCRDGDRLTDFELGFFVNDEKPRCPDCGEGALLKGPTAGECINVMCSGEGCGSKFNLMFPFGVDRISDAQPKKRLEGSQTGAYR